VYSRAVPYGDRAFAANWRAAEPGAAVEFSRKFYCGQAGLGEGAGPAIYDKIDK